MSLQRIGIIGHFGGGEAFNDGQTVKTLNLERALNRFGAGRVRTRRVDTYYCRHGRLRFGAELLACLATCRQVILLPSTNGRRVLFPLMYRLSRCFGLRVYHCAIGGRLADELESDPARRRYVRAFCANWVESRALAERLRAMGVENAEYMPNFKEISIRPEELLAESYAEPFRFCTFSRVTREKGVGDAIAAVTAVNARAGGPVASLDVYGPVEPDFAGELEALLRDSGGAARWCGVVPSGESVETLQDYFMLLFPTRRREAEGIPGTIIDALSAGVPVIARRWRCCDEMLQDGATGFCYDFDRPEDLSARIWEAMRDPAAVAAMKRNCVRAAGEFSAERAAERMLRALEEHGAAKQ